MKDKFFELLVQFYSMVYRSVLMITYYVITRRKCRGVSRVSREKKKEIKLYWKRVCGKHIPIVEYNWYQSKGVSVVPELIPDLVWHSYVEPYYANLSMVNGFKDKNYFQNIVGAENCPDTICHCINGQLLDSNYLPLDEQKAVDMILVESEVICKPSIESGGGRDICFISRKDINIQKISELKEKYRSNFIVQKIVKQHDLLNELNPNALNTMRIVSFLHKGKVYILARMLRVAGSGSRLDNVSSGGVLYSNNRGWEVEKSYYKGKNTYT